MAPTTFPPAFIQRIKQQFPSEADDILQSLSGPPPTAIRINPLKFKQKLPLEKVPWSSHGYYLTERPSFTLDPLLHAGAYYVQEASSMLLEQALCQSADLSQPLRVLDLCGAPGGKSTLLASLLGPGSVLVANEVIRSRAEILAENLTKWGTPNVIVASNDPRDFQRLEGLFDVVVVDAPCSGEGMFRKDAAAMGEWSVENASLCADRQRRILMDAWPALKPGGVLVYSTCTFNPAENEENMAWLATQAEAEVLPLHLDKGWSIREVEYQQVVGYQLMPHRLQGEGFFLCMLRKKEGREWTPSRKDKFPLSAAGKKEAGEVAHWLQIPAELYLHHETMLAFPEGSAATFGPAIQALRVVQAGVAVAQIKKKNLVPTPALALCTTFNAAAFPATPLNTEEALRYLRKEEWPVERGSDGWELMTFKELPLGWIKRIGHRFNNYFPVNWRIRMDLPKEMPEAFWGAAPKV